MGIQTLDIVNPTDIPTLDISKAPIFPSRDSETTPLEEIAQSILAALRAYPHYVVVHGCPAIKDRTNLMNLSKAIGAIERSQSALGFGTKIKEKISFTKVHINPLKAMERKGVTQYSRTHLPLAPHTDSSYMSQPHEIVAFQCIVSDHTGGESIMIPVTDLLKHLDSDVVEQLRAPVYPFGSQSYPILAGESGHEQIRYYRSQIDRILERGAPSLSKRHRDAIETLDEVLQQTDQFSQFHLQAGHIVFMNNLKVLHGRTGFSPESDRLLYRVRLHVNSLASVDPTQPLEKVQPSNLMMTPTEVPSDHKGDPIISTTSNHDDNPLLDSTSNQGNDTDNTTDNTNATAHQGNLPEHRSLEEAEKHVALADVLNDLHRFDDALTHYRHASQLAPNNLAILNAYGTFLLHTGQFVESAKAFCRCLKIDPHDYDSGLALSSLAHSHGDHETAQSVLKQAIQKHPYVLKHPLDPQKPTLLRIRGLDGSAYGILQSSNGSYKKLLRGGHFSIRNLVDKKRYNLIILNVLDNNVDTLTDLPKVDLLLNTVACPDLKRESLLAAARLVDRYPAVPLINDPRHVLETTRERNALRLNLIPGVRFPKTERLRWDGNSLDAMIREILGLGFSFPIIIRLVGSQTGSSVAFIEDEAELRSHFQESQPNREYYIIQFQDCCNSQNVFNKIRVFFVDGNFYPVANLFHDSWNVHSGDRYQVMDKTQWTQDEEKSFLRDPVRYIGSDNFDKLCKIRDVVGLDFFGIDFTILEDGTLFIFELNAAMRHNYDHAKNFPYTEPYLQRVSIAFDTMIQRRLNRQ